MTSVPTTSPPEDFMPWMDPYNLRKDIKQWPYSYKVVEIWRPGCTELRSIDPNDIHPMTNVHNWYWRPVM
jgi:hypothetical protein